MDLNYLHCQNVSLLMADDAACAAAKNRQPIAGAV